MADVTRWITVGGKRIPIKPPEGRKPEAGESGTWDMLSMQRHLAGLEGDAATADQKAAAKQAKATLEARFPGTKFTLRTHDDAYGGRTVVVYDWATGPPRDIVSGALPGLNEGSRHTFSVEPAKPTGREMDAVRRAVRAAVGNVEDLGWGQTFLWLEAHPQDADLVPYFVKSDAYRKAKEAVRE